MDLRKSRLARLVQDDLTACKSGLAGTCDSMPIFRRLDTRMVQLQAEAWNDLIVIFYGVLSMFSRHPLI